jgi:RNA polymerase sigma factor (sigma-70 family)
MPAAKPIPPLSAKQAELAADYVPLACKMARLKAKKLPHLRDELIGEAMLELCVAAATWKPRLCPRFATFAMFKIRWRLQDMLRRELPLGWRSPKWRNKAQAASRPIVYPVDAAQLEEKRGQPLRPVGRGLGQASAIDLVDAREEVLAKIARVPNSQGLLHLVYVDGLTVTEAGEVHGLNQSQAIGRHTRVMHELRLLNGVFDDQYEIGLEDSDDAGAETV